MQSRTIDPVKRMEFMVGTALQTVACYGSVMCSKNVAFNVCDLLNKRDGNIWECVPGTMRSGVVLRGYLRVQKVA
jgi:hypothetical protein